MNLDYRGEEKLVDIATIIATGSALGSFIVTSVYVYYTKKILQANQVMTEESKKAREESSMPDVIAYFNTEGANILNFRIKNIGKTVAINTLVELEPIIPFSKDEYLTRANMVNNVITTLAPEQQLEAFVGMLFELKNTEGNFPSVKASIRFEDINGNKYERFYILDLNMYKGKAQIGNKTINDLTKEVEKLRKEIATFNNDVVRVLTKEKQKDYETELGISQ